MAHMGHINKPLIHNKQKSMTEVQSALSEKQK